MYITIIFIVCLAELFNLQSIKPIEEEIWALNLTKFLAIKNSTDFMITSFNPDNL